MYNKIISFIMMISILSFIGGIEKSSTASNHAPHINKEIKEIISEYKTDTRKPNNDTKYILNKKFQNSLPGT